MPRVSKGGQDRIPYSSPEFNRRQERNAHNACFGGIAMARVWMVNIQQRRTTTPEAKGIARDIEDLLYRLKDSLKQRIDQ